jgi:hypothetical protein
MYEQTNYSDIIDIPEDMREVQTKKKVKCLIENFFQRDDNLLHQKLHSKNTEKI